jgi:hypothetical protein
MGNAEAISYFAYGWKFWLNVLFCSVLVGWQRTLDPQLPKVSTDLGTPRRYIVLEKLEKGGSVSLLYQLLNPPIVLSLVFDRRVLDPYLLTQSYKTVA